MPLMNSNVSAIKFFYILEKRRQLLVYNVLQKAAKNNNLFVKVRLEIKTNLKKDADCMSNRCTINNIK